MRQFVAVKSITNSRHFSFQKYIKDINKYKLLTSDEEYNLVTRMRAGDTKARELLILSNLRFVVSVAKQYQNSGLSFIDLINEGNIGLMRGLDNFDETKGFKLISYAVWWIRQNILCAISDNGRLVRLPHNKINFLNKISSSRVKLYQELQREPTIEEIAEDLEMSVSRVSKLFFIYKDVVSIDKSLFDTSEKSMSMVDNCSMLKYNEQGDGLVNDDLFSSELENSFSCLSKLEKEILTMSYGIGSLCPFSIDDIAYKLQLRFEEVKKIKYSALRKLNKVSRLKVLKDYL